MRDSGFSIHPDGLTLGECDRLLGVLSAASVARSRAGARHLLGHPAVASLASGPVLTALARQWLGPSAIPFRATLFEKSGTTNWLIPWHQDTALPLQSRAYAPGWGPWSVKAGVIYAHAPASALSQVVALRVHLDASSSGNGPLRVVPGSHRHGVLSDARVLEFAASHGHAECLVPRGGIVAMRPLLIHSSAKALSGEPRRVLHIEYAASLDLGAGLRLAVV